MNAKTALFASLILCGAAPLPGEKTVRIESDWLVLEVAARSGRWSLLDRLSGCRWPSEGTASLGSGSGLDGDGFEVEHASGSRVRLSRKGVAVAFEMVDAGRSLTLSFQVDGLGDIRALDDALSITDREGGYVIVPCREGLLVRTDSGREFRRTFGTSDYEGSHMNVMGFVKAGSALLVSWDDAYVFPELSSTVKGGAPPLQRLSASFNLRRSARSLTLTPLGKGDWNTLAAGYRRLAREKGLAVPLREKIQRNPRAELLVGAANVKLWTCLARRMNEASTREESVTVRWTFDEAARIAAHLRDDLDIERCLFILGGWTEGGYDCRHPDNLPANEECGGNGALRDAVRRIQKGGYVACLHDNYQDMYRDARSWDPALIEKRADGSLVQGGRWLGGRAYMVCAPKQLELARRPQNLPRIRELFEPWSYFIDTTFAVGPRECRDPDHPLERNGDIAAKIRLSDYARGVFGLFGSECGREWALPHSDFFEGLVGVSGRGFHNLKPAELGAEVIPFWEMVYHDCQIAYGKYGYAAEQAAGYVAHHVLCARPLHYHSVPDHLYWKTDAAARRQIGVRPRVTGVEPAGQRAFRIRYAWDVDGDVAGDWRVFVHFGTPKDIRFQDDHDPPRPTSSWKRGESIVVGPHTVRVPSSVRREVVNIYVGLFDPRRRDQRAHLPDSDSQKRVLAGRLHLVPTIRFEPVASGSIDGASVYLRSDGGWAEGLHPYDVFLKNTHEVLGPLHAATAHRVLERFEFLSPDRAVRSATYGQGDTATSAVVNLGGADAEVRSRWGGRVVLPPWGFVVDSPGFAAFFATRWGGHDYAGGTLFTLRALDGRTLEKTERLRVFHGFGDPGLMWMGRVHQVDRERIIPQERSE